MNRVFIPLLMAVCISLSAGCGTGEEQVTTNDPCKDTYVDFDGDGFGASGSGEERCNNVEGFVTNGDDCDDASAASYPGATEVCDGEDNDCDGEVDEACVEAPEDAGTGDGGMDGGLDDGGMSGAGTPFCEEGIVTARYDGVEPSSRSELVMVDWASGQTQDMVAWVGFEPAWTIAEFALVTPAGTASTELVNVNPDQTSARSVATAWSDDTGEFVVVSTHGDIDGNVATSVVRVSTDGSVVSRQEARVEGTVFDVDVASSGSVGMVHDDGTSSFFTRVMPDQSVLQVTLGSGNNDARLGVVSSGDEFFAAFGADSVNQVHRIASDGTLSVIEAPTDEQNYRLLGLVELDGRPTVLYRDPISVRFVAVKLEDDLTWGSEIELPAEPRAIGRDGNGTLWVVSDNVRYASEGASGSAPLSPEPIVAVPTELRSGGSMHSYTGSAQQIVRVAFDATTDFTEVVVEEPVPSSIVIYRPSNVVPSIWDSTTQTLRLFWRNLVERSYQSPSWEVVAEREWDFRNVYRVSYLPVEGDVWPHRSLTGTPCRNEAILTRVWNAEVGVFPDISSPDREFEQPLIEPGTECNDQGAVHVLRRPSGFLSLLYRDNFQLNSRRLAVTWVADDGAKQIEQLDRVPANQAIDESIEFRLAPDANGFLMAADAFDDSGRSIGWTYYLVREVNGSLDARALFNRDYAPKSITATDDGWVILYPSDEDTDIDVVRVVRTDGSFEEVVLDQIEGSTDQAHVIDGRIWVVTNGNELTEVMRDGSVGRSIPIYLSDVLLEVSATFAIGSDIGVYFTAPGRQTGSIVGRFSCE